MTIQPNPNILGSNPAETAKALCDLTKQGVGCRAVMTTMFTYAASAGVLTASATGAMASQDGVSMVAGDSVFIPEGITRLVTGADAGPFDVVTPGTSTTAAVLRRPAWWKHGDSIPSGHSIRIGGEGTLFGGSNWKTFVTGAKVVDTDAPAFYPDFVCQSVTLAAGLITVSNVPVRSTTKSLIQVSRTAVGGTVTTTVQYNPSAITAGVLGTGSFQVAAQTSTGATDTADTSTLSVSLRNW